MLFNFSFVLNQTARNETNLDPKFIKFPSSLNLDEGSSIKIESIIAGTQPLTCKFFLILSQHNFIFWFLILTLKVKWFKNNEEIIESDRIKFVNDTSRNSYCLLISTVLSTDDGQYYAMATNSSGEATAAFSLIVSFEINDSNLIDVKKILEKSIEHK